MIIVDEPEVFTRERLVKQRLEERAWLQRKLDEPFTPSFQGLSDRRVLEGFVGKVEANLDPLGGAGTEIQQTLAQAQLARAQSEALKAENELARLRALGTDIPSPGGIAPASSTPTPTAAPGSFTGTPPASTVFSDPGRNGAMPDVKNTVRTSAQLSSDEALNDEAAFRTNIRARMLEQDLDDTHDLRGRTLYTLKFDLTVISGESCDALGHLHVKLTSPQTAAIISKAQYKEWVTSLHDRIAEESVDLERRWKAGQFHLALSPVERQRVVSRVAKKSLQNFNTPAQLAAEEQRPIVEELADYVADRYRRLAGFSDLVTIGPNFDAWTDPVTGESRCVAVVEASSNGPEKLAAALEDSLCGCVGNAAIQVYTVEPKELAQNISDVSARENLLNLAGGITAAIPAANVGLKGYAEYIRRSQELLQAILRKPLVVGIADGADSFGWIIGPRFRIEKDKAVFGHSQVPYSVEATIAVPAWWDAVRAEVGAEWIDGEGKLLGTAMRPTSQPRSSNIKLPGDPRSITAALLQNDSRLALAPAVYQVEPPSATVGSSPSFLIRGRGLWRNPEVYLGSLRASDVHLLPDMDGLWVSFTQLITGDSFLALRVITSAGESLAPEPIKVVKSNQVAGAMKPFAVLKSTALDADSLVFGLSPSDVPPAYAGFKLVLLSQLPDAPSPRLEIPQVPFVTSPDGATLAVNTTLTTSPPWWSKLGPVLARLQVQLKPDGPWLDATTADAQFIRVPTGAFAPTVPPDVSLSPADMSFPIKVSFTRLDLARRAYPDFDKALRSNGVDVVCVTAGRNPAHVKLLLNTSGDAVFDAATLRDLVAAPKEGDTSAEFTLRLDAAAATSNSIPAAAQFPQNTKLKITRTLR